MVDIAWKLAKELIEVTANWLSFNIVDLRNVYIA